MKPRSRKLLLTTALGSAVLLAVTACTGSSTGEDPEERELVSMAPAAVGPVDRVVWNLPTGEPSTIDPPNAPTYSGASVISNLCDSLLTIDADYNVSPNLAEFNQVSDTELKLTIRDDAKFWDGTPVTAEDVAFSLQRSADPAAIVSFIYANVASIEVTGENEVTILFSAPDELFTVEMTTFAGMVMQKAYTESVGAAVGTSSGGVMCSGPFVFEEWVPGDHITISKNADYWNADRIPLAGEVEFTFVTDSSAYTQAMKAGEIDGSHELAPTSIPALLEATNGNLYFGPSTQSLVLSVARPDGPLADIGLRNALQTLVDRDALAEIVFNNAAAPLYTVIAPTTWQNDAREVYEAAAEPFAEERAFDAAASKAAVEASGYAGTEIVLAVPAGDATLGRVAQLVQQQAKDAGVTISIKTMQQLDFAEAQYDPTKRVGIDLFASYSFNAVQDPLEPTGFLYLPGAFYNLVEFDDPEVTALLIEARQTFDAVERAELFAQAQERYEAASAIVPLLELQTVTFLNSDLAGAVTSFAYLTMPSLATVGAAE